MPSPSPKLSQNLEKNLRELGLRLREHRKKMGLSAIVTAEAAELSRITLYRIERGEASVSMGAYLNVIFALGLKLELAEIYSKKQKLPKAEAPQEIRIADYKQLKRLAWQLKDTKVLTAAAALDLYERNWRHVDIKALDKREEKLIKTLLAAFGRERLLV